MQTATAAPRGAWQPRGPWQQRHEQPGWPQSSSAQPPTQSAPRPAPDPAHPYVPSAYGNPVGSAPPSPPPAPGQYPQPYPAPGVPGPPGHLAPTPPPPGGGDQSGRQRWAAAAVVAVLAAGLAFGVVKWMSAGDDTAGGPNQSESAPASVGQDPDGTDGDNGEDGTGDGSSENASEDPAKTQATAVDELLGESADDRQKVIDAVNAVASCDSPESVQAAKDDLTAAAGRRDDLLNRLGDLDLDAVEGGVAAAAELKTAWQHSADADRAFADWAANMSGGACSPANAPHDGDYDRGAASSGKASTSKEAFVDKWNPIAAEHGLEARSANAI